MPRGQQEAIGYGGYVLINTRANNAIELGKSTEEFAASLDDVALFLKLKRTLIAALQLSTGQGS